MNKRRFLKAISASLAMASAPTFFYGHIGSKKKTKRLLMLGGRNFIGPSIVIIFKEAGWDVTLLNRGITNRDLFNELPIILCDREKEDRLDLKRVRKEIEGSYWDCVIDTWQKSPKAVSDFINEFKENFGHYHYVSTVSVYDDWNVKDIKETNALNPVPKFPETIKEDFRYAIRKTLAEITISENLSNYTIYRSHGMRDFRTPDHSNPNEENYWPIRFARGGEILVPDDPNHFYQITDVQSLCAFILHCAERKIYGVFNVAYKPIKFKDYVASLIQVTGKPKKLVWIPGDFLIENGLIPYKVVSAWRRSPVGAYDFNVDKALENGLVNRPPEKMIEDQIAGYQSRYPNDTLRYGELTNTIEVGGLSMQKEKEIIAKWKSFKN